ncbi:MAG: hypothetical protein GQ474_03795 [Sulfurimonas sp.]|nr:hypothetical protein [Sulfurimonas sp.]
MKRIIKIIASIGTLTLLLTGCAPSMKEVAKTAWFKDYKTFNQQIKELDIAKLSNDEKKSLVSYASQSEYEPCKKITYIVENGGTLSKGEYSDALFSAARHGIPSGLQCLLDLGADINIVRWYDGNNALHVMIDYYDAQLDNVKFLVTSGIDIKLKNKEGKMAMDYAKERGNKNIEKYLFSQLNPEKNSALESEKNLSIGNLNYASLNVPTKYKTEITCKSLQYEKSSDVEKHILSKSQKIGSLVCKKAYTLHKDDLKFTSSFINVKDSKTVEEALKYGTKQCRKQNMHLPSSKELQMLSKIFTQDGEFWYMYKTKKSYSTFMTSDKKQFSLDDGIKSKTDYYTKSYIRIGCINKKLNYIDLDLIEPKSVLRNKDKQKYDYALIKMGTIKYSENQKFELVTLVHNTYSKEEAKNILYDLKVAGIQSKKADELAIAKSHGYNSYANYLSALEKAKQLALAKSKGYNSWTEYQVALLNAKQLAEAKLKGYNSWEAYQIGLKKAKKLAMVQSIGFNTIAEFDNKRSIYKNMSGSKIQYCKGNDDGLCKALDSIYSDNSYTSYDGSLNALGVCFNIPMYNFQSNYSKIIDGNEKDIYNQCKYIMNKYNDYSIRKTGRGVTQRNLMSMNKLRRALNL